MAIVDDNGGISSDLKDLYKQNNPPERDMHCANCAGALSDLERHEYRDHCTFCTSQVYHRASLMKWIRISILDYRIHRIKKMLFRAFDDMAQHYFNGAMGALGERRITDFQTIKSKKDLIAELKRMLKI